MKKNKILINIQEISDIEKYEKLGYSNFLLPLSDFSIGYKVFSFEEIADIKREVYVLINRLLTDEDIDTFLKLKIPKSVKGFIIEDIGLLEILKEKGYEVINFQNHLNNNYLTINFWLKYYDSVVLNNDITTDEIIEICKNAYKPLIISAYGYPMIMYSRRTLVSNYSKNYDLPITNRLTVKEKISKHSLIFEENEYGTAVFDNKIIDYRKLLTTLDSSKIKFFLFNTYNLTFEEVVNALNGKTNSNESEGFLHTKTVYKIGDLK